MSLEAELKDKCGGYRNGQQQLQGILSDVVDSNAKWAEEVVGLRKKLEDLKCCGNCRRYPVAQECRNMRPGSYCPGWLPDGLKREDRE